ncbi:MAG: hypothetical protein HS132_07025 [Planctomycetia bacterium]|nr:hypothetical protein [Planctomycetia bacterium]
MSFTTSGSTTTTDTSNSMQARYTFEEGVGTIATDSSGNNRNGTITGPRGQRGKSEAD